MKRIIYKTLPLLFAALCFTACDNEIKDIPGVQETLQLTPSATNIALDENNMQSDIITFNWTKAREVGGDHLISYTTKLDLIGNNFGSSTVIMNYEDDGIFSRSFTTEQLNNWATEKWRLPVNQPFTLEFRVVAEWSGGATFEAPEVRTVTVEVEPIYVEVFGADHMYLAGNAIPNGSEIEIFTTAENENQYAWYGELVAGELQIPVELEGSTYYLVPENAGGTQPFGQAIDVKMQEANASWNIPADGAYRFVINMEHTTLTMYSPENPLPPAVVTWMLNGEEEVTTVNNLWEYGEPTGWSWRTGNWTQSMADPQVFIYSGPSMNGRTKFGVAAANVAYVYTGNNTAGNTPVTHGTEYDLYEGYSSNERNAYFTLPSGTNFIILDIRNKRMTAFNR